MSTDATSQPCVNRTGCETPNDCKQHGYCRSPNWENRPSHSAQQVDALILADRLESEETFKETSDFVWANKSRIVKALRSCAPSVAPAAAEACDATVCVTPTGCALFGCKNAPPKGWEAPSHSPTPLSWQGEAYIKLGAERGFMTDAEVRVVQQFIGQVPEHKHG